MANEDFEMRVLAVDDDPFILQVLQLALTAMGCKEVTTAESAEDALHKIREAAVPFDCLLLDIQMPQVDGIELCGAVRRLPQYKRCPIIMLTAMSEREYIDRAFAAGATDYMTKPFETLELNARLQMALRLNREIRSKQEVEKALAAYVGEKDLEPAVDIEDALSFEDMPGHLDLDAFRNYVGQLRVRDLVFGGLAALKIVEVGAIFSRMKSRDYLNFLADIGDAISETLPWEDCRFSYAGGGYFLILAVNGARPVFENGLSDAIQGAVDDMDLRYRDGERIMPTVVMSDVKSRSILSAAGSEALIEAAVKDVELKIAGQTRVRIVPASAARIKPALRVYH